MKQKKTIQSKHEIITKKPKWPFVLFVIIGFVFFGNSIKNGFNMDDDLVTTTEDSVHENVEKGIAGIPAIFNSRYVSNSEQNYSYRPVTTSTFAIEYSIFGNKEIATRASISHFINLMLFILNGILVYLVVLKLVNVNTTLVATVSAVLFMIHPLHSEVVNNIKCRDELLVFVFGFLALLSFLKYSEEKEGKWKYIHLILGFVLVSLSVLSKKTGVTFVVTIPLVLYFFRSLKTTVFIKIFVVCILGAFVLLVSDKVFLDSDIKRDLLYLENPLIDSAGLLSKLAMFFYSIGWYLKMMLMPYPLSFYYGFDAVPIANWGHLLTWVGVLFVVPLTILSLIRIKKKEWWSFGFLFFMFSIGGIANLKSLAPGIVAERFAYLPSFGLIASSSYYLVNFYLKKREKSMVKFSVLSFATIILLLSMIQNINRNTNWSDKLTLYKHDLAHNDRSAKSYSLLGQEYIRRAHASRNNFTAYKNYSDSAVIALKKSFEIYPRYWTSANNIGYVYQSFLMDNESAIRYFKKATEIRDNYSEALFGLASCYALEIESVNKLTESFGYINVDSINSKPEELEGLILSTSIIKAAFFEREIQQQYHSFLQSKGVNLLNSNFHDNYIKELRTSIDNFLILEKGILHDDFNINAELLKPTLEAFGMMKQDNILDLMKTIEQGVAFKFNIFNANYISKSLKISHYDQVVTLGENLGLKKKELIDSAVFYFDEAINSNVNEVRYYQETARFLHQQGLEDKFVEINQKGVSQLGISNKVQLYVNLANVYSFREQADKSISNIVLASENAILVYKKSNNPNLKQVNYQTIKDVIEIGLKISTKFNDNPKITYFNNLKSQYK